MNYLNIEIPKLNSAEVVGSDPVERGTWLMLSGYCADQENGGRISGCRGWKDRMWQQLAGVTLKEVMRDCKLWTWDGDDLVVWGYPVEQEDAVRRKRETGTKGGRPRKPSANQMDNHMVSNSETISETERKGKEGKEKERNTPLPPAGDSGRVMPDRWQNIPKIDRKNHKVLRNNRLMQRIGAWFNRRPETLWTIAEGAAISQINPPSDEVDLLESWYLAADVGERDYRRRDLLTLLHNWNTELDRARLWKAENP